MKLTQNRAKGFTLLEIMLVVSIIVLLLGAAMFKLGNVFQIGVDARLQADFAAFDQALKTYEMNNGFLPTTDQGLQALVTAPTTDPKPARWYNLLSSLPKDPYNQDYVYVCPGKHNPQGYDIYSKGKDRTADTADDRGNWEFNPK